MSALVEDKLKPKGEFELVDDVDVAGGHHAGIENLAELYLLPEYVRVFGMTADVVNDPTPANNGTYKLVRGEVDLDKTNNANWVLQRSKVEGGSDGDLVSIDANGLMQSSGLNVDENGNLTGVKELTAEDIKITSEANTMLYVDGNGVLQSLTVGSGLNYSNGELAADPDNFVDAVTFSGGTLTLSRSQSANIPTVIDGRYVLLSDVGLANGVTPLNSSAKIDELYLPDSVLGQVDYQNVWDASSNTPAIPAASSSNKGHYYITVNSVSSGHGYSNIPDTDFEAGDWIISNGSSWAKVDNSDAVTTVFGRNGNIVAADADYTAAQIVFSPYLTLGSTRVQAAIQELKDELDTEASAIKGVSFTAGTGLNVSGSLNGGPINYSLNTTYTDSVYARLDGADFTGDISLTGSLDIIQGANYWTLDTDSSGKLTFQQNGVQRGIWSSAGLEIDASLLSSIANGFLLKSTLGNHGIVFDGTSMHIQSSGVNSISANGTTVTLRNTIINTTGGGLNLVDDGDNVTSNPYISFSSNEGLMGRIGYTSTSLNKVVIENQLAGSIEFLTSNSPRWAITSAGHLAAQGAYNISTTGIATIGSNTNTGERLQVRGSAVRFDADTGTDFFLNLRMGTGGTGGNKSGIRYQNSAGTEIFNTHLDNNGGQWYRLESDIASDILVAERTGKVSLGYALDANSNITFKAATNVARNLIWERSGSERARVYVNASNQLEISSSLGLNILHNTTISQGLKLNLSTIIDIAAQANSSIDFGLATTALPTFGGKSNANTGLYIYSASPNSISAPDMRFDVRDTNNVDFTTLTNKAFQWSRFNTELMSLTRSGNLSWIGAASGDGSGITNIQQGALPSNVAYKNATQTFTEFNTFSRYISLGITTGLGGAGTITHFSDNYVYLRGGTGGIIVGDSNNSTAFVARTATDTAEIFTNGTLRYSINSIGTHSFYGNIVTDGTITATGATLSNTFVSLAFNETDQAGAAGLWRWEATGGTFQLARNTAVARDFSTRTFPINVSATDIVTFTGTVDMIDDGTNFMNVQAEVDRNRLRSYGKDLSLETRTTDLDIVFRSNNGSVELGRIKGNSTGATINSPVTINSGGTDTALNLISGDAFVNLYFQDVAGNGSISYNGSTDRFSFLNVSGVDVNGTINVGTGTTGYIYDNGATSQILVGSDSSAFYLFRGNGTDTKQIQIGTNNTETRLHGQLISLRNTTEVLGTLTATGAIINGNYTSGLQGTGAAVTTRFKIGDLTWNLNTGSGILHAHRESDGYSELQITNSASLGALSFNIRNSTGSAFSVANNGNLVTIGTITATGDISTTLDVLVGGNGNADSRVRFYDDTNDEYRNLFWDDSESQFKIEDSAGAFHAIVTTGNVDSLINGNFLKTDVNDTFSKTDWFVNADTTDGADSKAVGFGGGGSLSTSRGAYFAAYGNEHATNAGRFDIRAGSTGYVDIIGNTFINSVLNVGGTQNSTSLPLVVQRNNTASAIGMTFTNTLLSAVIQMNSDGSISLSPSAGTYISFSEDTYISNNKKLTLTGTTDLTTQTLINFDTLRDWSLQTVNNGASTHLQMVDATGGKAFRFLDSVNTGFLDIADGTIKTNNGANDTFSITDDGNRGILRLYRSGGTAYTQLWHDGTDGVLSATAGNIKITNTLNMVGHIDFENDYAIQWGDNTTRIQGNGSSDYIDFYTNGLVRGTFNSSGLTTIGATINGNVNIQGSNRYISINSPQSNSFGVFNNGAFHASIDDNGSAAWLLTANQENAGDVWYGIQVLNIGTELRVYAGSNYLSVKNSLVYNGFTVMDGAGNLNATTLNGFSSSQFARTDIDEAFDGHLDIGGTLTINDAVVIETANEGTDRSSRIMLKEQSGSYLYGLSLGYSGDATPTDLPSGYSPLASNGAWALRRHDNSIDGTDIMFGEINSNNIYFAAEIHAGSGNSTNWNTAYTRRIATFTTTGNSGAATFTPGGTLNVPNYTIAGLGGVSLSGSYSNPSWIASLDISKITGSIEANTLIVSNLDTAFYYNVLFHNGTSVYSNSGVRINPNTGEVEAGLFTSALGYGEAMYWRATSPNPIALGSIAGTTRIQSSVSNDWRFINSGDSEVFNISSGGDIDAYGVLTIEDNAVKILLNDTAGSNAFIINDTDYLNFGFGSVSTALADILKLNLSTRDATFLQYVTAEGFKTPTGTSSGFLKADGSVDTTVYLTSGSFIDGSGTATTLAKFIDGDTIGDSIITDDGFEVSIDGDLTLTGVITAGGYDSGDWNSTAAQVASTASNWNSAYTFSSTFNIANYYTPDLDNRYARSTVDNNFTQEQTFNSAILVNDILFPSSLTINSDTVDGADTASVTIAGGGAGSRLRGGYMSIYGNEHANTGDIYMAVGVGGEFTFRYGKLNFIRDSGSADIALFQGNGINGSKIEFNDNYSSANNTVGYIGYGSTTFSGGGMTDFGIRSEADLLLASNGNDVGVTLGSVLMTIERNVSVSGTLTTDQYFLSGLNTAPSSATDTGTTGELRITADYVYVCVATNTWKRSALSTWT